MLGLKNALWRLGLVLAIFTVFLALKPPQPVDAVLPEDAAPGEIFTGRFIPAFIGGAYDPSEAFAAMAGLPVYVVAFNDWAGSGASGDQTWVIGDLAIRTQIRADGTFQVQGLPAATSYGVYFPFSIDGSGNVIRTDCKDGRDDFTGTTTGAGSASDQNACKSVQESRKGTWPFRMPRQEDLIVDVFSYSGKYLASEAGAPMPGFNDEFITLDTQVIVGIVANTPRYERIRLEHIFVTNRKEVDVENNINTFPLVPTTVIKVEAGAEFSSGSYEVWAMRYARMDLSGTRRLRGPINWPIIRGRMIISDYDTASNLSDYVFQAYAPPGEYVVIAWQKEKDSPTYLEWNGNDKLNTHRTGIAQYSIKNRLNGADNGQEGDWRKVSSSAVDRDMYLRNNALTIWGLITNESGDLLSEFAQGPNPTEILPNAYLTVRSDNYYEYYTVNQVRAVSTDFADYSFLRLSYISGKIKYFTPVTFVHNKAEPQYDFYARNGLYIVTTDGVYPSSAAEPQGLTTYSDGVTVSLTDKPAGTDTNRKLLARYSNGSIYTGAEITSVDGPRQWNLSTSKSDHENLVAGVKNGIYGYLKYKTNDLGTEREMPVSNAEVSLRVITSDTESADEDVPAELLGAVGSTNSQGQFFIPGAQLVPLGKTGAGAKGYENLTFLVSVKTPVGFYHKLVGNGTADPFKEPSGAAFDIGVDPANTGVVQLCATATCEDPIMVAEENIKINLPDKYNLAALNWLDQKVLNVPDANAIEPLRYQEYLVKLTRTGEKALGAVTGSVSMRTSGFGVTKSLSSNVYLPCLTCSFRDAGTAARLRLTDLSDVDRFYVRVPGGPRAAWGDSCLNWADGIATPWIKKVTKAVCDEGPKSTSVAQFFKIDLNVEVETATGEKQMRHSQVEFGVKNDGTITTAEPIQMALGYDCAAFGAEFDHGLTDIIGDIKQFYYEHTCAMGLQFGEKIGTALTYIEDYGLKTRALTQDKPIRKLYDISRNLANLGFLIIFVAMAIMTALRYQSDRWHTRVILPQLLKALFFANYSIVFVQAMLDANNFLTATLFQFTRDIVTGSVSDMGSQAALGTVGIGAGATAIGSLAASITSLFLGLIASIPATGGGSALAFLALALAIVIVIGGQIAVMLISFLMRYAIIWLVTVTAPIVFMFSVLPPFANFRSQWVSYLSKVSFIQTEVAVLISIAVIVPLYLGSDASIFTLILTAAMSIAMLYMATKIPRSAMAGFGAVGKLGGGIIDALSGAVSKEGLEKFQKSREEAADNKKMQQGRWRAEGEAQGYEGKDLDKFVRSKQRRARISGSGKFVANLATGGGVGQYVESRRTRGGAAGMVRNEELTEKGSLEYKQLADKRAYTTFVSEHTASKGKPPKVNWVAAKTWLNTWKRLAPQGMPIPVRKPDGSIDYSGGPGAKTWQSIAYEFDPKKNEYVLLPYDKIMHHVEALSPDQRFAMQEAAFRKLGGQRDIMSRTAEGVNK